MWRRALLGSQDDVVRVLGLWGAWAVGIALVLAGTVAWDVGLAAAAVLGGSVTVLFRWRRRRWDALVDIMTTDLVSEAESALRKRSPRPPDAAPGGGTSGA